MNKKLIGGLAAAVVAATGITLAAVPSAQAQTTVTLRSGDFIAPLTDVRAQGHVQFADNGLSVVTDPFTSATSGLSKAAAYWDTDTALADAGEPALDWSGTDTKPGINLLVDLDGDASTSMYGNAFYKGADAILVGETVYKNAGGTPDWWATASSSLPAAGAPESGGGFGSDRHGTLAGWRQLYPHAKVVAEGFSLGSGGRGSGVINAMTLGDTTYSFTGKDKVVAVTPPGQLAAPTGVKVTATGTDTVTLSWNAVPGAANYRVFTDGVQQSTGFTTGTSVTIGGLQLNKHYGFSVAAGQVGTDETGTASAPVGATTRTVTLAAPANLKAVPATTSITVTANVTPYADHYLWYVNGIAHGSSDQPSYSIVGLKANTSYTLSVRADTITTSPGPVSKTIMVRTK